MSIYKITLEPIGAFFFGGERSFSISTRDKHGNPSHPEDKWSSYIVESNKFPQQTSLLGMLRFVLLKNSSDCFDLTENKIKNGAKDKVEALIGPTGFKVNQDYKENKFGVINSISPCYIEHNCKLLMPTPLDYGLKVSFPSTENTAVYNNTNNIQIPYIESLKAKGTDKQYSGKTERVSGLLYLEDGGFVSYDKVFTKDTRVGINRDIKTGKTGDNALFKQVSYKLKNGCKFCFYATITDDSAIPSSSIAELGGDSSKFAITFSKLADGEKEPNKFNNVIKSSNKPSVVLLADTFIDNNDYIYAISENTPFTFLVSSVAETTQYNRTPKQGKTSNYLHRSDRYSLFKRGSVFYFNEKNEAEEKGKADSFAEAIESKACFFQIGYNKCEIK